MTPQHPTFETFYDDQVAARRQLYSRETIWDRLSQPTILISILILAVTVGYNLYGSSATLEGTISLLATCLWDALVHVLPGSFLNALDDWINPSLAPRPMLHPGQSGHAAKSETMKRILGLDRSGGMMASVFQARSRALSMTGSVLGLKIDSDRPAGLGNRDNSCYQNSILQGLASLKPLPEYLSAYLQASEGEDGDRDVAQTLRTLIADLNDGSNNGRTLWTPSLLKSMSTWTQQDAQEYFSKILDDIDKSVANAMKSMQQQYPGLQANIAKDDTAASQHSDDSGYQSLSSSKGSDTKLPRNPLEGLLAQRVACVQCGHSDGLSMIPFTCLTLSLGLNKNQHDLYERLDAYSKVESIENVECAKCTLLKAQRLLSKLVERLRESSMPEEQLAEPLRRLEAVELALEEDEFDEKTLTEKCKISQQSKVSSTKTKQIVVARPPQSLAIHMNRSVFDPTTFNMMKNSAPVDFPMTLDLGPWCLGSAGTTTAAISDSDTEEQWQSDPRESMIAGDMSPSKLTGPIYELRAVVTHYGRHENGHYICYRKYPRHAPPPSLVDDNKGSAEPGEQDDATTTQSDARKAELSKEESGEVEMDWWRLSDHNVSVVNEETVLSLSPGVFMLFYDCVDPNTVLTAEDAPMQDAHEEADTTAQGYGTEGADGSAACEHGTKTVLADRIIDDQQQAEAETATETAGSRSVVNTATAEETETPDVGPIETLNSAEEKEARTTGRMTSP
ncbi:ubiquitin-specific protease ubp1 [Neonectria punicea]|uniref:ubiquitinyl hydrolase 1 n=1 Tax=Neonectria punicea TaxID=979145 RepID=A0ABR1H143_9HYPO